MTYKSKWLGKWLDIPELNISVEIEVHDKNKSWNELELDERENELLTVEQCIFLANSKYAEQLKMDGSSDEGDFYIKQPFNLNKKNNLVSRFVAVSGRAYLDCDWDRTYPGTSLGVRFRRAFKKNRSKKK